MLLSTSGLLAAAVTAAEAAPETAAQTGMSPLTILALALGAGVIILSAALGIASIAGKAVESIGRQPEASSDIRSSMIVAAALIEGVTFFALLIIFLALFWTRS